MQCFQCFSRCPNTQKSFGTAVVIIKGKNNMEIQTKERREKMKNLKQIARATTLTGIIILTTIAANAGILVSKESAAQATNPCEESDVITTTIDDVLSTIGVTESGILCGMMMSD